MKAIAVVAGSVDIGESDRIMRLLSDEHGRLSVVARRARSSKKRWAGLLDVGCQIAITAKRGRGDLATLTGADLIAGPRRARESLVRIALMAYGCELCHALAPEATGAPKLHRLLVAWLTVLEGAAEPGAASRLALDAKALTFAGLTPALDRCARCGDPLYERAVWDPEAGGALHPHCGGGRSVRAADLARIEELRRTPLADTPGAVAPDSDAWGLLTDFAQHQLSRAIRSRAMVEDALSGG